MQWVRSYPRLVQDSDLKTRRYVWDPVATPVYLNDFDYSPLADVDDDVMVLEWDMAASLEDMQIFEAICKKNPHDVLVGAYELYHVTKKPVWAHRRYNSMTGQVRWVHHYEDFCDLFSFGMTYIPQKMIREFMEAPAPERGRPFHTPRGNYNDCRFTDQTFSMWHAKHYNPVRIVWGVFPIHLHFEYTGSTTMLGTMQLK